MFAWWHRYKQQRAIDLLEAEINQAEQLLLNIKRAQREYERLIKNLAAKGIQP